jgi:hypothetical protein
MIMDEYGYISVTKENQLCKSAIITQIVTADLTPHTNKNSPGKPL